MDIAQFISDYQDVLSISERELNMIRDKAEALVMLSDTIEQKRTEVARNDLLDMRLKMDGLKKISAQVDKLVKASSKWVDDAILVRLKEEELDNYSYAGKLYYPSTTNNTSVADRTALEAYIKETGRLDMLGNTLNKQVVSDYFIDRGELPPGVTSYNKTRLNCRAKP